MFEDTKSKQCPNIESGGNMIFLWKICAEQGSKPHGRQWQERRQFHAPTIVFPNNDNIHLDERSYFVFEIVWAEQILNDSLFGCVQWDSF